MAISNITEFTGNLPNELTQTPIEYSDALSDTHLHFDNAFVADLNTIETEFNTDFDSSLLYTQFESYKGDYLVIQVYGISESVTYNGKNYISLVANNTGNQPDVSATEWRELKHNINGGASTLTYDDTVSGLGANTVQGAFDELAKSSGGTKEFTASGTLASGEVVALNADGTVSTVIGGTIQNWIGISKETVTDTNSGKVSILKGIDTNQTGLTIGSNYFVDTDGTLTTTDTGHRIGRALSATDLLITGDM